jgi:hypothetical protein
VGVFKLCIILCTGMLTARNQEQETIGTHYLGFRCARDFEP